MARVLVLNATYEPINVCTLRRAAVLLLKERAELLERRQGALHSERMTIERPDVIRLVSYVRIPREAHRRKGNRLPREIQMHPRKSPRAPGPTVFIQVASPKIPAAWQQYLPAAA